MALRTITVKIEDENSRDFGKHYIITELPASQAEKWGIRAINAILASGIELPDEVASQGLRGVAMAGISSIKSFRGLDWRMVEPLLDEMMTTVQIIPDPSRPGIIRNLIESDILDIKTRLKIRNAWLELHLGFSLAGGFSISAKSAVPEPPSNT